MELVDPRSSGKRIERQKADRLPSLDNRKIALLINGKANAEPLARQTAALFERHHGCKVVEVFNKGDASRPCPAENLKKLSEVCEFLITTVGD